MGASKITLPFAGERGGPNTRLKILQGAAQAFGDRGLGKTTVEDIIDAAGVSRPSFYKFFRNKDEVFDLLHEMVLFGLTQAITIAAASAENPVEKLERAVEAFLRALASAGPLARAVEAEAQQPGSPSAARERETVATLASFFESEAVRAGRPGVDPLLYRSLVAALREIGLSLIQETNMTDADIQRGKEVAMRLLVGSLAQDDPVPPLPRVS